MKRLFPLSIVTMLGFAAFTSATASCGDDPAASAANGSPGTAGGVTCTAEGCPCTTGNTVACGMTYTADHDFLYCYQGTRACIDGKLGPCAEGSIIPKAMNALYTQSAGSGTLHARSLGSPTSCTAPAGAGIQLCVGGLKDGEICLTAADCPSGGTCAPFVGICEGGPRDGEGCNVAGNCPAGACEIGAGLCLGGSKNGKKCHHNHHCANATCTAESTDAGTLVNPCDPNCSIVSDTPVGIDAGPGLGLVDGGLSPISLVVCGDSVVSPGEQCDDGNTTSGDGCNSTCKLEPNFQCPTPGSPCTGATCGNGIVEGLEQCDDGPWTTDATGVVKDRPFDGCYNCQREFKCPVGTNGLPTPCTAVCGDGIVFPGEACDDGNTVNGDGCSSTCTVETGATCVPIPAPLPAYLDVPVIYRDFDTFGGAATSPDFQFSGGGLPDSIPHRPGGTGGGCVSGVSQGIAKVSLSPVDREPELLNAQTCIRDAASYATWWHDSPNNKVILGKFIRLASGGGLPVGTYQFDSANDPAYNLPNINCGNATPTQRCQDYGGFFPINGLGFGNQVIGKNYSFTSELRFPFTYSGGESLTFIGDDDLWVWIGGRKVVDIGNPHVPATGTVTLNLGGSVSTPASATAVPPITLTVGETYEISVFQAERNSTGSNYKLTLAGFNRKTSQCTSPLPPSVFVRDFQASCAPGSSPVWQLFRWKAGVVPGASIAFRAATAATQAALPNPPPGASPVTVPIGTADTVNSPPIGPFSFKYDTDPGPPVTPRPVSKDLDAIGQKSEAWLRVYMTFNGPAVLYEWDQQYDCIPNE